MVIGTCHSDHSHSQGGANGAGMANKLIELGYNVEIIEYITPHQAKDIKHPEGVPEFK